MPSDSMNIQEQGFRSRMFGGFDKNDVLAYMNTLANEAQQHELEYQEKLRQLQAQLDDLRSQRSDAEARVEALKAELAAANQRADLAERANATKATSSCKKHNPSPKACRASTGRSRKMPTSGS